MNAVTTQLRTQRREADGFERRVDLLASTFTGMSWGTGPSPVVIEHYLERGRTLRSAAWWAAAAGLRRGLAGLATGIVTLARGLLHSVLRARRRRAALRELYALDDRTLYDIGLHRSEIDAVVESLLAEPADERGPTLAPRARVARVAEGDASNDPRYASAA